MTASVDGLPTIVGGAWAVYEIPWTCAGMAQLYHLHRRKGTTMNFNDRLTDLRKRKGLSQEQLGYELGVSRQTVSKWELGQSYPDFQRLVLLSDYYEMSLDELVRGVDVGDVRALNESEKQISSIYSDVERGKEAISRAWRAFLIVGCIILAFFAAIVTYGVVAGGLFVR